MYVLTIWFYSECQYILGCVKFGTGFAPLPCRPPRIAPSARSRAPGVLARGRPDPMPYLICIGIGGRIRTVRFGPHLRPLSGGFFYG